MALNYTPRHQLRLCIQTGLRNQNPMQVMPCALVGTMGTTHREVVVFL